MNPTRPFKANIPKRLSAWIQFADPPNHGHGAACECTQTCITTSASGIIPFTDDDDHEVIREDVGGGKIRWTIGFPRCPHCAGTGRIICDDERAGRVSPSHVAGGYAEWRRKNQQTSRMPIGGAFRLPSDPSIYSDAVRR